MPLLKDLELELDAHQVLRAQGADPAAVAERRPALLETAGRALKEGLPLLEPRVLYRELSVRSVDHERLYFAGGTILSGPFISRHLAPARKVVIILCTIGGELEKQAMEITSANMVYGLALDGVGSAAVEALANLTCRHFEVLSEKEGMQSTIPFHPGMSDWPVEEGQPQIFGLLDAKIVGVELTSSFMMVPRKSLTMLIGIGPGIRSAGSACDYCSMKDTCLYREHHA